MVGKIDRDVVIKRAIQLFTEERFETDRIKALCHEFNIGDRQARRWLKTAREDIVKAEGKTREELAAESLNWYAAIYDDPTVSVKNRIEAHKAADAIRGLRKTMTINQLVVGDRGRVESVTADQFEQVKAEAREWTPPLLVEHKPDETSESA